MNLNTYVAQIKNEALLERVIHRLSLKFSARTLAGMVQTSVVRGTSLMEVAVEHNDPYTAPPCWPIPSARSSWPLSLMLTSSAWGRSLDFLARP